MDVCGPMCSRLLSRYVYYISFIEDLSCKTWIYLLKGKSKFLSKFKEYNALVENQTDRKINNLRSDKADNSHQMNSRNYAESLG